MNTATTVAPRYDPTSSNFYLPSLIFATLFVIITGLEAIALMLSCCLLFCEADEELRRNSIRDAMGDQRIDFRAVQRVKVWLALLFVLHILEFIVCVVLLIAVLKHMALFILIYIIYGIVFLVVRFALAFLKTCGIAERGDIPSAAYFICCAIVVVVINVLILIVFYLYYADIVHHKGVRHKKD